MKTIPAQQTYDTLPSFEFECAEAKTSFGPVKIPFLFTDLAYCCGISVLSNIGITTDEPKLRDVAFEEFYQHILKHTTQAQIVISETPNPYRKTNAFITWLIQNKPKDYLVSDGYVGNALYLGADRGGAIRMYTWVPEQRQFCYRRDPAEYGELQPLEKQEKAIMEFVGDAKKGGYCRARLGRVGESLNFYQKWRSKSFSDYEAFERTRFGKRPEPRKVKSE